MAQTAIKYVSDNKSKVQSVIVPIELWNEIESAKETAYLLKSPVTLEKLLEPYCCKSRKAHAPYKHNLLLLAEEAGLKLSGERKELLAAVNRFNIEER